MLKDKAESAKNLIERIEKNKSDKKKVCGLFTEAEHDLSLQIVLVSEGLDSQVKRRAAFVEIPAKFFKAAQSALEECYDWELQRLEDELEQL